MFATGFDSPLGGSSPQQQTSRVPTHQRSRGSHIEFVAYAEDCLMSGQIRLDSDRLTDLLNQHDEYELIDVLVTSLADGHSSEIRELVIEAPSSLSTVSSWITRAAPTGRSSRVDLGTAS